MTEFFLTIVNMSISASWIVLAVLLLRLVLKKAPKWITVLLWGIVAVRLICPFSLESALSLIPSAETINPQIMTDATPQIQSGISVLNNAMNIMIAERYNTPMSASLYPLRIWIPLAAIIWIAGMIAMLVYTAISYRRVKRKIGTAVLLRDNIFQSENVVSPFVLGIIKPKIYLPFQMAEQDMAHVIAHENAHIRRKDHLWKPFGFLLLSLHWFNPFMWLGYILLCRDIELACDEKVIKEMDTEQKADYSQALLACSVNRRMIAACPLAFGEVSVKNRVKSVLNYKKPAFWIIIIAIVAILVLAVCFLTNPSTGLNSEMSAFIEEQILEHHNGMYKSGEFCCTDFKVLGKQKRNGKTTVYMWVLYQEYSAKYGNIENVSGAHIPTVVTLQKSNGQYELVEYWEAKDGTLYAPSIKEKFPLYLYGKATDSQRYIKQQQVACDMKAVKYFGDLPSFGGLTDFEPTVSYANWLEDSTIYIGALNRDKMYISSVQHLPIYKFDTLEDIQQFKKHFENHHSLDQGYNEVPSFNAATVNYDEVFFSKNSLLLVYVGANNSTHRFGVSCITRSDRSFYVQVGETTGAEAVDTAMAGWFITLAVADEVIKNCTDFDAVLYHDSEENLPVVEEELPEDALILMDLEILKLNWPMYFDLPTESGLEVYIWEAEEDAYACVLLSVESKNRNIVEYLDIATSLEQMQAIVGSYIANGEITKEEVTICPITWAFSSRPMDYYETYLQEMTELFWSGVPNADNPVMLTSLSYATCSNINWIFAGALNKDKMYISSVQHLPIYKFDTLENLQQFKKNFENHHSLDQGYNEVPSFNEVTTSYDESFFEENSLILVYVGANNSTHRFGVQGVEYNEQYFCVNIKETTGAEAVDTAMAGWFITLAVPDAQIKNCTTFDADLNLYIEEGLPEDEENVTESVIRCPYTVMYEQTPIEDIERLSAKEEFVYTKMHYQTIDGKWHSEGRDYLYRLEVTGRLNNAAKNTTYIVLCNESITFDQAWKASGFSSNSEDYFDPADAVIVGYRTFS